MGQLKLWGPESERRIAARSHRWLRRRQRGLGRRSQALTVGKEAGSPTTGPGVKSMRIVHEVIELPFEHTLVVQGPGARTQRHVRTKKGRNHKAPARRRKGAKTRTPRTLREAPIMRFVGIDLHKRSLTACVIDRSTGETFARRFPCSQPAEIVGFFEDLRPFRAVVEATATYDWLWELLEPLAERLVLAHPGKIRVIAESMKKTDRSDAAFLAWLLSQDSVPQAHRPSRWQREYQHLVRHRCGLVRQRSKLKTQIRALLSARNLDAKSLFSAQGEKHLERIRGNLSAAERFRLDELLALMKVLDERVLSADKALSSFRKAAAPAERKNHRIVTSVPGIGPLIADVIISSLGDVARFRSIGKVKAYAGLVPGFRESDKKRKELGITKQGSRDLRWSLVQAAWRATRLSPSWEEVFARLARRRGRKKAVTAVAARLLGVVYTLLKKQTTYRERLPARKNGVGRALVAAALEKQPTRGHGPSA